MWADVQRTICFICLSLWQENVLAVVYSKPLRLWGESLMVFEAKTKSLSKFPDARDSSYLFGNRFFFLSPLLSKKTKFPETHRSKFEEFKSVVSNFHWSLSF